MIGTAKWNERGIANNGSFDLKSADAKLKSAIEIQSANQADEADGEDAATRLANIATGTSDVANAARITIRHGHRMRYCHQRGAYLVSGKTHWTWDESGRAIGFAKETALSIYGEAQIAARAAADAQSRGDEQEAAKLTNRATALAKWALASQKRERINAMLALAQCEISISADQLDADPLLINHLAGTFDVRAGKDREHRASDYITKICRAAYRPGAKSVLLANLLARIFRSILALVPFIQRVAGYCATGSIREQCVFFCYGRGANGKTTLIDAFAYTLGDYAAKADPDLLMARDGSPGHPCDKADLIGRRLAICSETQDGKRFDEARLKDLSGETRIKARFMYQNPFEFAATHKLLMYGNHKPAVRGIDHGFWRRMKLVPFVETIGDDEKDPDLSEKLKAEADGILTWIIDGAVEWYRNGLQPPAEVADATAEYRTEMDSIGAFLAESCIDGEKLKSYAADLYAAYCRWADSAGEHSLSQKRLGTTLAERGYTSARCSYSDRKMWVGIGLKVLQNSEIPNHPA